MTSFVGEHLDYFIYFLVSRTGTAGWKPPNNELKCQRMHSLYIFWPLTASITMDVRNNCTFSKHKEFWKNSLNWTFLWDVWFGRDAVYSKIQLHTSKDIDEMKCIVISHMNSSKMYLKLKMTTIIAKKRIKISYSTYYQTNIYFLNEVKIGCITLKIKKLFCH